MPKERERRRAQNSMQWILKTRKIKSVGKRIKIVSWKKDLKDG